MNKIVVVIMGQNCEKFIPMCLKSVKDADAIVYCDGGSVDKTLYVLDQYYKFKLDNQVLKENFKEHSRWIIEQEYNQEDKEMNGKQRNFYLEYVKKNYPGWFCLALDADEVVEDFGKLREWVDKYEKIFDLYPCCSVKMRHFISDLGHEDSTVPEHFVPHRLFKITNGLFYPLGEHPVLNCKNKESKGYTTKATTIWHLAYIPNLWDIKRRYDNHMKKSEIHTPEFLKQWYYMHLFGTYPKTEINLIDIPEIILKEFGINKDEFYFSNRGLEVKHFVMAKQWLDNYRLHYNEPDTKIIEFGCGRAPFGYAFNIIGQNEYTGVELSQFAVDNAFVPIKQGDITTYNANQQYDLVLCIDVLEHLNDIQLNQAMINLIQHGDTFIFSVPVIGDPNLKNDKTHKQFKTKEEWINFWESYGIKIKEAPQEWLFHEQLFIGERK